MSSVLVGGKIREQYPLFEMEDDQVFSFLDSIPDEFLYLLADTGAQERIIAVEKAIRRIMNLKKDGELLHWFQLLKRTHALAIAFSTAVGAGALTVHFAEECLNPSKNQVMSSIKAGESYRKHLKTLYTELPDAVEEICGPVSATFFCALPKTKTWILGEIANGWNPNAYPEDQQDCLLFLSMAADGPVCAWNYPYARAFVNKTSTYDGWKEVRKCIRNLLRERAEKYEAKELSSFLQNPYLKKTVYAFLWHAFVAKMMERAGDQQRLQAMLTHLSW